MNSPIATPKLTRRQFACGAAMAVAGANAAIRTLAADRRAAGLKVAILGDSACIPDVGHEAASFLINGKHLVDTGWCMPLKMRQYGIDPLTLESIVLTHLHQDHYIGLPQLLFYVGLKKGRERPLAIIGPSDHLEHVVKAAFEFLQLPRFPQLAVDYRLFPLRAGDTCELPDLHLETCAANHISGKNQPEQALVYKATDKTTRASFVFTGDTSYHPPIAQFAKGTPLLIHDGCHTSPKDAARIAQQAGVGRLALIHYAQERAARVLAEAQAVFPNAELAKEGSTLEVPAAG